MRLARNAGRSAMVSLVRESLGESRLVLGVDRLDYSKGIPDRIKAFERSLEKYPEWLGKATLLQLTPKSRSDIRQYSEIESEVTGAHRKSERTISRRRLDPDPLREPFLLAHRACAELIAPRISRW